MSSPGLLARLADRGRDEGLVSTRVSNRLLVVLATLSLAAFFLALAANARADLGVRGHYEFGQPTSAEVNNTVGAPGVVDEPEAAAVNGTGAGGVSPGDFYLADTQAPFSAGPARIQQFSASGEFKRLWGFDSVDTGPGNAEETQLLRVTATGGTYTLEFDGALTPAVAYDASAAQVESTLNGLATIGGVGGTVAVEGGPGDATGTQPYRITFEGSLADVDQPLLSTDGSGLSGAEAEVVVDTSNPGGTGFEICEPSIGDICQRGNEDGLAPVLGIGLDAVESLEVNQLTGDVYLRSDLHGIMAFSASGDFKRAFGYDVVARGPSDGSDNPKQRLVVTASGGTYILSSNLFSLNLGNASANQTPPILYNADAGEVEEAIEDIPGFETIGGDLVFVSGGPSGPADPGPYEYEIELHGTFTGDVAPTFSSTTTGLAGAPKAAAVTVLANGGGPEICTPSDLCKTQVDAHTNGSWQNNGTGLGLVPAGPPNAGNLLLADNFNGGRALEFSETGEFVRLFGWDVVASGPGDSNSDEVQQVVVKATGGKYSLSFDGERTGASGTGRVENGSTTVKPLVTSNGVFEIGELISGTGIPAGTTVTAVAPGELTLSNPATTTNSNLTLTGNDIPYDATAAEVEAALNALSTIGGAGGEVAVTGGPGDATGSAPYEITFGGSKGGDELSQMTSTKNLTGTGNAATVSTVTNGGASFEVCTEAAGDICKDGTLGSEVGQLGGTAGERSITADSTGAIYVLEPANARRVQKFSPQVGPPTLSPAVFGTIGAPNGTSQDTRPIGMAIGPSDEVFVAKAYPAGAETCADGSSSPQEFRVQELTSDGTTLLQTSKPCAVDPTIAFAPQRAINQVKPDSLNVNPENGDVYLLNDNAGGRVFTFGEVGTEPTVTVDAVSNIGAKSATISGDVTPNGPGAVTAAIPGDTKYKVEYRKVGDSEWTEFSPNVTVGTGNSPVDVSVGLNGLTPKTEYEARIVATKAFGFAPVSVATAAFTTLGAPPRIDSFWSRNVTASSVDLLGVVNPLGTATSFHFEYGKNSSYGSSTPEVEVGESGSPVAVEAHVEGLEPVTQHFRLVATSAEGTTTTTDQTFNFYPESCPNEAVRQQTGSGSLPDCRAYELVSPENMGSIILLATGPSSPLASSPARFGYSGGLGTIQPFNPPNSGYDGYVATRTTEGWKTGFVGIPADVSVSGGSKPGGGTVATVGSRQLDKFLQWGPASDDPDLNPGASNAPYVHDETGAFLGRWPTNLVEAQGADISVQDGGFVGEAQPSPDFSHYFFSSNNVAFAPGGLTTGVGSVYDNQIASGAVSLVSKTAGGLDIEAAPGKYNEGHYLQIPAASADGSHVLIGAPSTCASSTSVQGRCPASPSVLYMRVDNALSYDVSQGEAVTFEDMTEDGEQVVFSSTVQLTSDDHDTSVDIFRWDQGSDSISRVSIGEGEFGDTDNCTATWIAKCAAEIVPPEKLDETISFFQPPSGNAVGRESGNVYFYSPEQLVGGSGIPGRRNLYVERNGQAQYVTTFDSDKPATRFQVSADGRYAAFLTATQLTNYNNAGFDQMYVFDAGVDSLLCASCDPEGNPPNFDVRASSNGLFMADDGRAFFSTQDALVPADTNQVVDVYEFVGGRPRLISSGVGESVEISEDVDPERSRSPQLVGVSADGVDVYFATQETLVAQDHNGPLLKFYDARTNGGFAVAPQSIACAAADECHGAENATPAPPSISTTASLGDGGNTRSNPCVAFARRAKRYSSRAKSFRRRARRLGRSAGAGSGRRASKAARRSRSLAGRARKLSRRAKRCRAGRARRSNGRAER